MSSPFIKLSSAQEGRYVIETLMADHYDELVKDQDTFKLSPRWEVFEGMDELDKLLILTAWDGPKPVGYALTVVDKHVHYSDLIVATNDLLFVSKDYRQTPLGLQLMRRTKELAKGRGAKVMLWHAKPDSPLNSILQRRSRVQDILYRDDL